MLAGSTGLEPAASGVTGRRSNQLNYDPEFSFGIADLGLRIRPPIDNQSAIRRPRSEMSPFRCLDQLIHRLGIVERLADREARAHPPVQLARLEQLVVAWLLLALKATYNGSLWR